MTSSQILSKLSDDISISTLKRDVQMLVGHGYLEKSGGRRDASYKLTGKGLLLRPFELDSYYKIPDFQRDAIEQYNFHLFDAISRTQLFSAKEMQLLDDVTREFRSNADNITPSIQKKELERFVIEFSWKSSQIEGNTYTLLETERLIRDGLQTGNHTDHETAMILNHKRAYEYLLSLANEKAMVLDRQTFEHVHSLVVQDLGVDAGLRQAAVGISGSLYRPLTIKQQIDEQLSALIDCINSKSLAYEKALVSILGESYLQPFADGNKRTARVIANGILMQYGYSPLSYRAVSDQDYKEATLIFYEQNSIEPFKRLFIDQYVFAAKNYNISKLQ